MTAPLVQLDSEGNVVQAKEDSNKQDPDENVEDWFDF